MEPLTSATGGRRGWAVHAALLAVLLSGPSNVARLASFTTSLITWPFVRKLTFSDNRFEIRNAELLLVYFIAVAGLNVLKKSGLISIGQSAPFLVGAYITGIGTVDWGLSFWVAAPLAIVVAGAMGLLLGVPALRLGFFTLAMVTLGYAFVATALVLQWRSITGGGDGFSAIVRPAPFSNLESFYWLTVIGAVVAYIVAHNLLRAPYGRQATAVSENVVAAQSLGVNPRAVKLRAFCIGSAFAGAAGALYAPLFGFISPEAFTVNLALLFVLMSVLGGIGTLGGTIIGTIVLFRLPLAVEEVTSQSGDWSLLAYGLVLLISVYVVPKGLLSAWWLVRDRILRRKRHASATLRQRADVSTVISPTAGTGNEPLLTVSGVTKNLGGVQALGGVDLVVRRGSVHALIGPNGSGKTTFLNIVGGYLQPDEGHIEFAGETLDGMRAFERARIGLGRTFQTPLLFETTSCLGNVMAALDLHRSSGHISTTLRLQRSRREERQELDRAIELLSAVGLADRVDEEASNLPPGERRLLELARVLAINPRIVLLDEPAAGLTTGEIDELEVVVRTLSAAGVAVLLVEHHVEMVMRLADQITVIDFGRVIADGPPQTVRRDPVVVAAYLGSSSEVLDELSQEPVIVSPPASDR
ncbi:MAG: branched-chain amino acid ABC transporter ATP-binding protein/permease [Ilumatobacteraceae bacterium]